MFDADQLSQMDRQSHDWTDRTWEGETGRSSERERRETDRNSVR